MTIIRNGSALDPVHARFNITVDDVSGLFTDRYVMMILTACKGSSKSAQQLSQQYCIPIAACYRKIHELEVIGLLECVDKKLTQEGKWVKEYRSFVKNIKVSYEGNKLTTKIELYAFPNMVEHHMEILNI